MAIVLECGRFGGASLSRTFGEVLACYPDAAKIGVDIPIGFPSEGVRAADVSAREFVGVRRNSVFFTPPLAVLQAPTYAEATERCLELARGGISRQCYGLRTKILQVDALIQSNDRVVEVHPEVSFRAMAGEQLAHSKKTWNGLMMRRKLLSERGIEIPANLELAGTAGPDDVLDAAAAAWSANRCARGEANALPESPDLDTRGRPIAIWY